MEGGDWGLVPACFLLPWVVFLQPLQLGDVGTPVSVGPWGKLASPPHPAGVSPFLTPRRAGTGRERE